MIGTDPTLTVSEFVAVFNQSLEMMYPMVGIVGELANFRISKGRWVYFDLKDKDASVKFFGTVQQLPGPLEDGLTLEVFGRPRLHPQYGFSINVAGMKVVGEGSLAKAQALLAKKLEAEGLFSEERKRELVYPPERIGLVTSVESAAYGDFIKIINQRWGNLRIELVDCLVQGLEAPPQLASAVEYFNQLASPPEVLVMVRGGGSADDLAAFSTEQVVRAVAASRVPTLVAIGHETDTSLAELAADKRASTPSNAAELLVPEVAQEKRHLAELGRQLGRLLEAHYSDKKRKVDETRERLKLLMDNLFIHEFHDIKQKQLLLKALNPKAPLSRGFALVRSRDGKLITAVKSALAAKDVAIDLSDGAVNAKVLGRK